MGSDYAFVVCRFPASDGSPELIAVCTTWSRAVEIARKTGADVMVVLTDEAIR